ncbi:enoyl-CoA hydratase/isomerase family protein [Methylobacterium sp. J-030]|uniref:enoyl-CoA hydratase/isomerase family protein n=1 Tax=Methylobacterium sp. J-030 TaxID=2836627 RepID=UPI001FB8997F|nr:enoyl-CoA hydratase/isomerase family protein [Methylobacterium sp. J-030]MCJ2072201.1 enoyl-CoA hydratase/isomerase family protein [Methylobacterium sp. J-030]
MQDRPFVRYAVENRVAVITLDRSPVNALSLPMLGEIVAAFRRASADEAARAVLLASAIPRRFSAGLDLDILLGKPQAEVRPFLDRLYVELADIQYHLGKPSIAAVNGAARGGGMTLSILCDVILAGDGATFGYPEIDLGLVPAIHFTHLPTIVGRHRAFELLFSGRTFDAAEAAGLGLVSRVVPDADLDREAMALARTFASKSPTAMRLGRAAFMRANDAEFRRGVAAAAEHFTYVAGTPDAQEGLRAFVEKRPPRW